MQNPILIQQIKSELFQRQFARCGLCDKEHAMNDLKIWFMSTGKLQWDFITLEDVELRCAECGKNNTL